ncbi:phosphoglycerate kinase [Candidatus Shapirobacteria bacterium]|nr:phosphoglycerate kinase [Candidatus Shapirobacteria bacterium]
MINLPHVKDLPLGQKRVLLRTNYDIPLEKGQLVDTSRIDESLTTLNFLLKKQAQVVILSHLGRPGGKTKPELSLKPVATYLSGLLKRKIILFSKLEEIDNTQPVVMLENLRFFKGEENNDVSFSKRIATLGDFFINEAFACSHRPHASIIGLPQFLTSAFGFDFIKEVEVLTQVYRQARRPLVLVLGGVKADKIHLAHQLVGWADKILIGGKIVQGKEAQKILDHKNVIGTLIRDKNDITMETIQEFKKIIAQAGTVIWAGPMGQYEEKKWEQGTREIAQAVVQSGAFTVIGGGDTEAALSRFGLTQKVNFISSGGGAMFEFLVQGTLPGIEAVIKR